MILQVEIGGHLRHVSAERIGSQGRFRFTIDGRTLEVNAARVEQRAWSLLMPDGLQHLVSVSGNPSSGLTVHLRTGDLLVTRPDLRRRAGSASAGSGASTRSGPARIVAPMPGKVVRILAAVGQHVQAGQGVVVVEAMKMENELRAPRSGVVKEVSVQEGTSVEAGALLAVVE
jgi:acetyl/propionyl-CoA carboxylase alpha subunit